MGDKAVDGFQRFVLDHWLPHLWELLGRGFPCQTYCRSDHSVTASGTVYTARDILVCAIARLKLSKFLCVFTLREVLKVCGSWWSDTLLLSRFLKMVWEKCLRLWHMVSFMNTTCTILGFAISAGQPCFGVFRLLLKKRVYFGSWTCDATALILSTIGTSQKRYRWATQAAVSIMLCLA
jgi:hypothetical protein